MSIDIMKDCCCKTDILRSHQFPCNYPQKHILLAHWATQNPHDFHSILYPHWSDKTHPQILKTSQSDMSKMNKGMLSCMLRKWLAISYQGHLLHRYDLTIQIMLMKCLPRGMVMIRERQLMTDCYHKFYSYYRISSR